MPRPKGRTKTVFATLRIAPTTDQLWEDVARALGLSKTAAMEMAIRRLAKSEGIEERTQEADLESAENRPDE